MYQGSGVSIFLYPAHKYIKIKPEVHLIERIQDLSYLISDRSQSCTQEFIRRGGGFHLFFLGGFSIIRSHKPAGNKILLIPGRGG